METKPLSEKEQSADFWCGGGQYETKGFLSDDVKQFIKDLKKSFICGIYPGLAGRYGNYALEEKIIKEFIEQMRFDEERGFLPRGYTDAMIKKLNHTPIYDGLDSSSNPRC